MTNKQNFLGLCLLLFIAVACTPKPKSVATTVLKTAPVISWTTPDWAKNAAIYEVNLRQYTKEGTIKSFMTHLPRLQKMGVKMLWVMPIYPICETNKKCNSEKEKTECLGSPYAVYDFEAVNPQLGTLDDVKNLVKEVHRLNMKIILDFVPDHTGWDSKWMKEHPEYFKKVNGKFTTPIDPASGAATDWTDVAMVDYNNAGLRKAMIDARLFWVKNADVDGFREDVAGFVPSDFWAELRQSFVKNVQKPLFMLSEWEDVTDHFTTCFEMNYGWSYHALIKEIAKGAKPATALDEWRTRQRSRFASKYYQMLFTQNHDENSWNGTEKESFGPNAPNAPGKTVGRRSIRPAYLTAGLLLETNSSPAQSVPGYCRSILAGLLPDISDWRWLTLRWRAISPGHGNRQYHRWESGSVHLYRTKEAQ